MNSSNDIDYLFNKVRLLHSSWQQPQHSNIDELAIKHYLSNHDSLPSLEEIDQVIQEVRNHG